MTSLQQSETKEIIISRASNFIVLTNEHKYALKYARKIKKKAQIHVFLN